MSIRNFFDQDIVVAMIQAVRLIVHENKTAEEAYGLYKKLGGTE